MLLDVRGQIDKLKEALEEDYIVRQKHLEENYRMRLTMTETWLAERDDEIKKLQENIISLKQKINILTQKTK